VLRLACAAAEDLSRDASLVYSHLTLLLLHRKSGCMHTQPHLASSHGSSPSGLVSIYTKSLVCASRAVSLIVAARCILKDPLSYIQYS
jgi:hypothetical protein